MKRTSNTINNSIIDSLLNGESTRKVADKHNVSQSNVARIAKGIKEDLPKFKNGRPGKVSEQSKRYLVQGIISNKFSTAVEATKDLKDNLGVDVTPNRVREILNERGLKGIIKKKKPLLTLKHRKSRMEFVNKYEHWTEDDWMRVIWSDETKINLFGSNGIKWGWKKDNMSLDPRILSQTIKHGGGNLMVWGCMTWDGVGFISRIEGCLDSVLYVDILNECIPMTMNYYDISEDKMIFQQDNDPKHTSKRAMKYFDEKNINLLFWPPQSPDLNPIEHLWGHLKREISKYSEPPKGCNMLWERAAAVFNAIPKEVCQNLIRSMPARIQAVKKAKGGHTKY